MDYKQVIRTIPDYPKPGIMFRDITTLLGNPRAFRRAVDEMVQPYAGLKIDKVAGLEARGFILGGAVAHQLSAGFIPLRKKGKLPHLVLGEDYDLEYGKDRIEIRLCRHQASGAGRRHRGGLFLRDRSSRPGRRRQAARHRQTGGSAGRVRRTLN